MKYVAKAHRSDGWWAVEFPHDDRVFSQARRLDQVADMAAEALSMWTKTDVQPSDIEVVPVLPDELNIVQDAARARTVAAEATESATKLTVQAARAAREAGLTVRDIGQLLGVTHAYAARVVRP